MIAADRLASTAVDAELERIARWLQAQPWNRPGTDKSWVLRCMLAHRQFVEARRKAVRVSAG